MQSGLVNGLILPRKKNILTVREVLTANRTYFVRTDGSDSNTGLVNSADGAFLTWQKGVDTATALDSSIYDVTIKAGGTGARTFTVTANIELKKLLGTGELILEGNTSNNAEVLLTSATPLVAIINGGQAGNFRIRALRFTHTNTGTQGQGIAAIIGGCYIKMDNCNFGAFSGSNVHIYATTGGVIQRVSNYTISGGANVHINCTGQGSADWLFDNAAATITITGTPAFNNFVLANELGRIRSSANIAFSGVATGTRFRVQNNSIIQTFGAGLNYFAGNVPGVTDATTFGIYA